MRALNATGASATLDVLGESVSDVAQANATADEYIALLGDVAAAGLNANVSVKLTAFGLEIEPGLALEQRPPRGRGGRRARQLRPHRHGAQLGHRPDAGIYRTLRGEGHDNVGIVLQAYLRRTEDDLAALAPLKPSVRLVKGIYVEPEAIAFTDPRRDQPRVRRHGWRISSRRAAPSRRRPMTRR